MMFTIMPKHPFFFVQNIHPTILRFFVVATLSSFVLYSTVLAQDDKRIQQIVNTACVACHALDGNGIGTTFPKLSAQHAHYLEKQIKDYRSNPKKNAPNRINAIMNQQVSMLSDQDIKGLAAYFSKQPIKPALAKHPESEDIAKKLYRGGDTRRGIAACAGCHGPTGAGIPNQYPRIAGQFSDYTQATLMAFRSKERNNDNEKMMQSTARLLTDEEIKALADYLAGLQAAP